MDTEYSVWYTYTFLRTFNQLIKKMETNINRDNHKYKEKGYHQNIIITEKNIKLTDALKILFKRV